MQRYLDRPIPAEPAALQSKRGGYRDLLAVILRRRWVILAVALPIILISAVGTIRTSEMITAGTRVMIEAQQAEDPFLSGPRNIDYTVLMSSAAQIVMSIPVAEKAAMALMDSLPTLRDEAPAVAAMQSPERLRDLLLRHVEAAQIGESNILSILYRHPNPRFSLLAVGALTNAYIAFNIESQQNTTAIAYYSEQINAVQASMDSLMGIRAGVRNSAGYSALQANAAAGINQIMDLERELIKARSRREGIEGKLNALVAARSADPDFVPASSANQNPDIVALQERVETLTAKLAALRVQYQDDSEWVTRQKQLVAAAEVELQKALNNYMTNLRVELKEALQNEAVFEQAVTGMKATLAGYPEVERRIDSIDLQIDAQRNLVRALQLKRGEVRLKAHTDMRISNIIPLDTPSIAARVAGGKKLLYLGLAMFLAIALGFVAALFVESQDHRLHDRLQAEQYLEVPVLGAISQVQSRHVQT